MREFTASFFNDRKAESCDFLFYKFRYFDLRKFTAPFFSDRKTMKGGAGKPFFHERIKFKKQYEPLRDGFN